MIQFMPANHSITNVLSPNFMDFIIAIMNVLKHKGESIDFQKSQLLKI